MKLKTLERKSGNGSSNYRKEYQLYEGKPCLDEDVSLCKNSLEARIEIAGSEIGYGEWGDSKHFFCRQQL